MSPAQVEGDLKHGLTIGEKTHKHFVLRECSMGDMFDAEELVPASRQLAFRAALLTKQLVSIGDYHGPFTMQMLRKFEPADFTELMNAQDQLGEKEAAGEKK